MMPNVSYAYDEVVVRYFELEVLKVVVPAGEEDDEEEDDEEEEELNASASMTDGMERNLVRLARRTCDLMVDIKGVFKGVDGVMMTFGMGRGVDGSRVTCVIGGVVGDNPAIARWPIRS